jgi:hypothetical protein
LTPCWSTTRFGTSSNSHGGSAHTNYMCQSRSCIIRVTLKTDVTNTVTVLARHVMAGMINFVDRRFDRRHTGRCCVPLSIRTGFTQPRTLISKQLQWPRSHSPIRERPAARPLVYFFVSSCNTPWNGAPRTRGTAWRRATALLQITDPPEENKCFISILLKPHTSISIPNHDLQPYSTPGPN